MDYLMIIQSKLNENNNMQIKEDHKALAFPYSELDGIEFPEIIFGYNFSHTKLKNMSFSENIVKNTYFGKIRCL